MQATKTTNRWKQHFTFSIVCHSRLVFGFGALEQSAKLSLSYTHTHTVAKLDLHTRAWQLSELESCHSFRSLCSQFKVKIFSLQLFLSLFVTTSLQFNSNFIVHFIQVVFCLTKLQMLNLIKRSHDLESQIVKIRHNIDNWFSKQQKLEHTQLRQIESKILYSFNVKASIVPNPKLKKIINTWDNRKTKAAKIQ